MTVATRPEVVHGADDLGDDEDDGSRVEQETNEGQHQCGHSLQTTRAILRRSRKESLEY